MQMEEHTARGGEEGDTGWKIWKEGLGKENLFNNFDFI